MKEEPPNKRLLLTSPDAAQSVLRPLCLLSGLAAEAHVRRAALPQTGTIDWNSSPTSSRSEVPGSAPCHPYWP